MSEKRAKLNKDWILRGWSDKPFVIMNWTSGDQRELSKKSFYVAESVQR